MRCGVGRNGGKCVLRGLGEVRGSQSKAFRPEGWMELVVVNGSATCYHRGYSNSPMAPVDTAQRFELKGSSLC